MKRFINKVVMVAVGLGLGLSLAAGTCEAADTDIRLGNFKGNWCGSDCRFDITEQVGTHNGKVFIRDGHILATGQVDKVEVQQYRGQVPSG